MTAIAYRQVTRLPLCHLSHKNILVLTAETEISYQLGVPVTVFLDPAGTLRVPGVGQDHVRALQRCHAE